MIVRKAKILVALGVLLLSSGCRSVSPDSATKFGWDEDLPKDPMVDPSVAIPAFPGFKADPIDKNFCKSSEPGSCLTLIMKIPSAGLINDLGLSVLALGSQSPDFRLRLQDACQTAWSDYQQSNRTNLLHPLRRMLVNKVTSMRCIFQTIDEEYVTENTRLSDGEIGLSVRLIKFEVAGKNISSQVGWLSLEAKSTEVKTSFRSLAIYGGRSVGMNDGSWQAARGMPVAGLNAKRSLDRNIQWNIPMDLVKSELSKIPAYSDPAIASSLSTSSPVPGDSQASGPQSPVPAIVSSAISSFLSQARSTLQTVASGSTTALNSTALMLGLGFQAYKTLCGEDQSRCKYAVSRTDGTQPLAAGLKDVVPNSEAVETFRIAMVRSIQSVLDESFIALEPSQVMQTFDLKN